MVQRYFFTGINIQKNLTVIFYNYNNYNNQVQSLTIVSTEIQNSNKRKYWLRTFSFLYIVVLRLKIQKEKQLKMLVRCCLLIKSSYFKERISVAAYK